MSSGISRASSFVENYGKRLSRIFDGFGGQESGAEPIPDSLYIRAELVKIKEQFDEEIAMLANGSSIEMDKIRQDSVDNYLSLVKLRLQKNQKPTDKENDG